MTPKLIDIHAHVNFSAFQADREAVVDRALESRIWHINVGTQQETSQIAVELAESYSEGVYAIVGLHPIHTAKSFRDEEETGPEGGSSFVSREEVFDPEFYRDLASSPKVVALGETGLDHYHLSPDPGAAKKQQAAFEAQLTLAEELNKPVMLHIRDAYEPVLEILKNFPRVRTHAHFFAGDKKVAQAFLDRGDTLSFTGLVTFTERFNELIEYLPLDRLMVETDCPYVSPVPFRGRRNEPSYVFYVAQRLAEIKNIGVEKVMSVTTENAKTLFGLP